MIILGHTLPVIGDVRKSTHHRPGLLPHGHLHGLLRLVVLAGHLPSRRAMLGIHGSRLDAGGIRYGLVNDSAFFLRFIDRMLARRRTNPDRCKARHEVMRFLFDGLAFMSLGSTRHAVMTAQHPCTGFLQPASFAVHERNGCGREEIRSRGRIDNQGKQSGKD